MPEIKPPKIVKIRKLTKKEAKMVKQRLKTLTFSEQNEAVERGRKKREANKRKWKRQERWAKIKEARFTWIIAIVAIFLATAIVVLFLESWRT